MNSITHMFRKTCLWCAIGIISALTLLTIVWSVLLAGSAAS